MKKTITIDVGSDPAIAESPLTVVMDVHLPDRLADDAALFFCLPGGGVTRNYFDLDGGPGTAFSFAKEMAKGGHVVVTVDPVGVGESTIPADGFSLTPYIQVEMNHRAFVALRTMTIGGIDLGALRVIGGGHSAGGLLSALQQVAHRDFEAVFILCYWTAGLPHMSNDEQRARFHGPDGPAHISDLAREMFKVPYSETPTRESDTPAARALRGARGRLISTIGVISTIPGNIRKSLAQLDVPVFLGVGSRDMTGPPHLLPVDYESCTDFTMYVVQGAGHHIFVVDGNAAFFRRMLVWAAGLAVMAG